MQRSHTELVVKALKGDMEAFTLLVEYYRDAVFGTAFSHLDNWDDAQDAVQEAFIRAYLGLPALRDAGSFGPWLRRITTNVCADIIRPGNCAVMSLDEVEDQGVAVSKDEAQQALTRVMVRDVIGRLPEKTRLTTILCYVNGHSHAEVADLLGIPVNTVRSRLQSAKRQLSKEMIDLVKDILAVLAQHVEQHWGLPRGALGRLPAGLPAQERVTHFPSDLNGVILTAKRGAVVCLDENLAADLAHTVSEDVGDDYAGLLSKLKTTLKKSLPANCNVYVGYAMEQIADRDPGMPAAVCNFEVGLYCDTPLPVKSDMWDKVEVFNSGEFDPEDFPPNTEHVFGIRKEVFLTEASEVPSAIGEGRPLPRSALAADACSIPRIKVNGHWISAVGVYTKREYWNRGLGKAVLSALVEHIASEGGVALYNCQAENVASLKLARSVGFVEHLWQFWWKVREPVSGAT